MRFSADNEFNACNNAARVHASVLSELDSVSSIYRWVIIQCVKTDRVIMERDTMCQNRDQPADDKGASFVFLHINDFAS